MKINGCKNNYDIEHISEYFGESEESLKKCNNCEFFAYESGMVRCQKEVEKNENKGFE